MTVVMWISNIVLVPQKSGVEYCNWCCLTFQHNSVLDGPVHLSRFPKLAQGIVKSLDVGIYIGIWLGPPNPPKNSFDRFWPLWLPDPSETSRLLEYITQFFAWREKPWTPRFKFRAHQAHHHVSTEAGFLVGITQKRCICTWILFTFY